MQRLIYTLTATSTQLPALQHHPSFPISCCGHQRASPHRPGSLERPRTGQLSSCRGSEHHRPQAEAPLLHCCQPLKLRPSPPQWAGPCRPACQHHPCQWRQHRGQLQAGQEGLLGCPAGCCCCYFQWGRHGCGGLSAHGPVEQGPRKVPVRLQWVQVNPRRLGRMPLPSCRCDQLAAPLQRVGAPPPPAPAPPAARSAPTCTYACSAFITSGHSTITKKSCSSSLPLKRRSMPMVIRSNSALPLTMITPHVTRPTTVESTQASAWSSHLRQGPQQGG
jgi:hypothetical protein